MRALAPGLFLLLGGVVTAEAQTFAFDDQKAGEPPKGMTCALRGILDAAKLFEVEDTSFTGSGQVGVWTKADSVTYFDDLKVTVVK